jgi:hypothetical protein
MIDRPRPLRGIGRAEPVPSSPPTLFQRAALNAFKARPAGDKLPDAVLADWNERTGAFDG